MSNDSITTELVPRKVLGKGLSKLRAEGQIPAVIHNHGQESIHVSGDYIKLMKVYHDAGKHTPVEVKIGDKQMLTLIKDADIEPVKQRLRHVVFQAIRQDEKVSSEVPVVLHGDIPAEKASLMVIRGVTTLEIEALPRDLPEEIVVDASTLAEVGDRIQVSDIKVPEGVTIITEPEQTIARVEMPRDQIAEADAAAADLAADAAESADQPEETGEKAAEGAEDEGKEGETAKDSSEDE